MEILQQTKNRNSTSPWCGIQDQTKWTQHQRNCKKVVLLCWQADGNHCSKSSAPTWVLSINYIGFWKEVQKADNIIACCWLHMCSSLSGIQNSLLLKRQLNEVTTVPHRGRICHCLRSGRGVLASYNSLGLRSKRNIPSWLSYTVLQLAPRCQAR